MKVGFLLEGRRACSYNLHCIGIGNMFKSRKSFSARARGLAGPAGIIGQCARQRAGLCLLVWLWCGKHSAHSLLRTGSALFRAASTCVLRSTLHAAVRRKPVCCLATTPLTSWLLSNTCRQSCSCAASSHQSRTLPSTHQPEAARSMRACPLRWPLQLPQHLRLSSQVLWSSRLSQFNHW